MFQQEFIHTKDTETHTRKLTLLAQGAASALCLYGQQKDGCVLKIVDSNKKEAKHLLNEHTFLQKITHQYIITSYNYKSEIATDNLAISGSKVKLPSTVDILVLDHADKGSLISVIKSQKLTVPQLRHLFFQVCQGMDFLHCKYIVHRDLKPDNILVKSVSGFLECKIADFGFASSCKSPDGGLILFNSFKGTKRGYMAPEIHEVLENNRYYDARKTDVFALGVILFALMMGRLPFEYATKENNLYKLIIEDKIQQFWKQHQVAINKFEERPGAMVEDFKELFISMVKYQPNQRVTLQDVLDSSWVNGTQEKTSA